MKFSKHQKQHLQQQRRHLIAGLSAPFSLILSSMYSSRTLIILATESMREPNARVPRWYLQVLARLCITPTLSMGPALSRVQYQPANAPARTISPRAATKKRSQNRPKKLRTWNQESAREGPNL